jgi:hypothetical protein
VALPYGVPNNPPVCGFPSQALAAGIQNRISNIQYLKSPKKALDITQNKAYTESDLQAAYPTSGGLSGGRIPSTFDQEQIGEHELGAG